MKLYTKNNCEFCNQLQIPKNLKIPVINCDEDYDGFYPPQLPVLQTDNNVNIPGPDTINELLKTILDAKGQRW
jgi:hypothetical protein